MDERDYIIVDVQMKEWLRFGFDIVRAIAPAFIIPAVTFWSLRVINPVWHITYTVKTIIAFWLIYAVVRLGIRNIQSPDWPTWWSYD